jgi:uncharacterized protein involved in exopolysaccharide biosynthesis/Mrp family chromosome partitioning ATPase
MEPFNLDHSGPMLSENHAAPPSLSTQAPGVSIGSQQAHVINVDARGPHAQDPSRAPARGGFSLRFVLRMIFGRWRLIGVVAACIIVGTVAAIIYMPPHYGSEAKLLVRLGRESVVIDPTARIGQAAVPMEGRDKEINSEIELLKSRKLTELVVQSLGANRILGVSREQPSTTENTSAAIKLVEDKLSIEAIPESDILSIKFESRDPELARDLVAKLIEVYLDERADIYRELGDLKFFENQLATARQQQADIQQQLKDLRDSTGVSDTTQQRLSLLNRIDQLQADIDTNRADRAAQANSIDVVVRQVGSATASRQRQAQIAQDSLLDSLIQSQEKQKAAATRSLAWINEVDVKAQKLQQEATLAAARVTQYAEAYEQARIDQAMGQQRLSNISVAEPPVLPLEPKAPNRALLAIAGLFLAMTLGLGSALVAEELDHTVRRVEDLHALGLYQTVSVPFINEELDPRPVAEGVSKAEASSGRASSTYGKGSQLNQDRYEPLRGVARNASKFASSQSHHGLDENEIVNDPEGFDGSNSGASSENSIQMTMTAVGAAIRPAHPVAISPRLLVSMHGILERLMPSYDEDAAPRLIGVVGPKRGQGASTIALHLAVNLVQRMDASAQDPRNPNRVLLLDADVDACASSALAGVQMVRRNPQAASSASQQFPSINMTVRRRQHLLDVLTAGMLPEHALLGTQMPKLLRAMGQQYRHIVIDLPPLSENEAAARLAGLCSAVVLVCKADELRIETAQQSAGRLREARAHVAVTVLNQRSYPIPDWIYRRT